MTHTQTFIKLAIEGGWNAARCHDHISWVWSRGGEKESFSKICTFSIILDALAWQAVGKVKGWSGGEIGVCSLCGQRKVADCNCAPEHSFVIEEWLYWQHQMLDLLADGKSIEEALGELLK